MHLLKIKPEVFKFDQFKEFAEEFNIGENDLVFTQEFIYQPYMQALNLKSDFLFQEKYGAGEPSDEMINKIINAIGDKKYKRIIAVGGGTVIDIAKLLILKGAKNALEIFEKRIPLIKDKTLIIVPTTCGTGSEVTNVSIAEIKERKTKLGLATEEIYADVAVLIPQLLKSLPYRFFVASSIDALIHAVESYVSPKSTCYTELFSVKAMEMIINGYLKIVKDGPDARFDLMENFLIASNYAGIAFGNTGVGAVHALSYPLGGNYHVPHGEANYQFFTEVFKTYNQLNPTGKIKELNRILSSILGISADVNVYEYLETILNKLLTKKQLREFGMKEEEKELFTDSVIAGQQRLLVNNYVPLSRDQILKIYQSLY